jgi:hypothetical protein
MAKNLIVLILIMISLSAGAQEKKERETRVNRRDVPEDAREFINDTFEGFKRVRWYFEESNEGNSFEAKFRWNRKLYSVKFDTKGKIIDIEWIVTFEDIPQTAKENIMAYLNENFTSYRILKIQKQLLGDEENLEDYIEEGYHPDVTINFEFEIHGKSPENNNLWEILFSETGAPILRREIILPDNFNLDF